MRGAMSEKSKKIVRSLRGLRGAFAKRQSQITRAITPCERLESRMMLTATLIQPLGVYSQKIGGPTASIDLTEFFNNLNSDGTVQADLVTIPTSEGFFRITLDRAHAPQTVENFLNYVTSGRYNNTVVHRAVDNFVVQMGGYNQTLHHIATFAPVVNEFSVSNTRGTVAMAKVGGDPNSATSEFFVNLGDNRSSIDPNTGDDIGLDHQNGGFTVFGTVDSSQMSVLDAIDARPTLNGVPAFTEAGAATTLDSFPVLRNTEAAGENNQIDVSTISTASLLNYSFSVDGGPVSTTLEGSSTLKLSFSPTATGTSIVTVTATTLDGTSSAVGTLTVNSTTDFPPTAQDDIKGTVTAGQPTTINVLGNDSATVASLDTSSVTVVGTPAHGSATVNTDGTILYTPVDGYHGNDSFQYFVKDSNGVSSSTAKVTLTVGPSVKAVAADDSATTTEGTAKQITVTANDSAPSDRLNLGSVLIGTNPTGGSVSVDSATGVVTYTPTRVITGSTPYTDTFTYTIKTNQDLRSDPATVTVTVQPHLAPSVGNDNVNAVLGEPTVFNVLANDVAQNDPINPSTLTVSTSPDKGGTAVVTQLDPSDPNSYRITYTASTADPDLKTETFKYTVASSQGKISAEALVTVTIVQHLAAITVNDSATVLADNQVTIDVLSNDKPALNPVVDPNTPATDNDPIDKTSLALAAAPNHGSVTRDNSVTANPKFVYTPVDDFFGDDSFTYTIATTAGVTSTGTVNVTVTPHVKPAARDDNETVAAVASGATPIPVTVNVQANDKAAEGTLVDGSIKIVTNPLNGTATTLVDSNDKVTKIEYTPTAGFIGVDSLQYTIDEVTTSANGRSLTFTSVPINVNIAVGSIVDGINITGISFTKDDGTFVTVSFARGNSASFDFSGANVRAGAIKNRVLNVTGSGLGINGINATTPRAGALTITAKGGTKSVAIGQVNPDGTNNTTTGGIAVTGNLASIVANTTTLNGPLVVSGGVRTITLAASNKTSLKVGGTSSMTLAITNAADTSLTSTAPIRSIKTKGWVNTDSTDEVVKAPTISSLISTGDWGASITLETSPVIKQLGSASVKGTITGGAWSVAPLGVGSIKAGTINAAWSLSTDYVVNSIVVTHDFLGKVVKADGLKTLRVGGNLSNNSIELKPESFDPRNPTLGTVSVGGLIDGFSILSGGPIGTITAKKGIQNTVIFSGVNTSGLTSDAPLPTSTANFTGNLAFIKTLRSGGIFANNYIAAPEITTLALGKVTTSNNGKPFGAAAAVFKSVSARGDGGQNLSFNKTQLIQVASGQFDALLKQRNPGDFVIRLLTAPATT